MGDEWYMRGRLDFEPRRFVTLSSPGQRECLRESSTEVVELRLQQGRIHRCRDVTSRQRPPIRWTWTMWPGTPPWFVYGPAARVGEIWGERQDEKTKAISAFMILWTRSRVRPQWSRTGRECITTRRIECTTADYGRQSCRRSVRTRMWRRRHHQQLKEKRP